MEEEFLVLSVREFDEVFEKAYKNLEKISRVCIIEKTSGIK